MDCKSILLIKQEAKKERLQIFSYFFPSLSLLSPLPCHPNTLKWTLNVLKRNLWNIKTLPCTICSSFLYMFVESQKWKHRDRLLLLLILKHHQLNFHILSEGHLQLETICEINQKQNSFREWWKTIIERIRGFWYKTKSHEILGTCLSIKWRGQVPSNANML